MTIHVPVPDYEAARRAMVESQLRPQGVTDRPTLLAMGTVPREEFVPAQSRPLAYVDRSIAIGDGRFLSAPAVLGQLLTEMVPQHGETALVVGSGMGYSAAVLAAIGCDVVALESDPELVGQARERGLAAAEGPLAAGHKAAGPYDLILIDGAVEYIPDPIVKQLAERGRLGAALNERGTTRLIVGRKVGGAFGYLSIGDAGVAPLPGFERPKSFTF